MSTNDTDFGPGVNSRVARRVVDSRKDDDAGALREELTELGPDAASESAAKKAAAPRPPRRVHLHENF